METFNVYRAGQFFNTYSTIDQAINAAQKNNDPMFPTSVKAVRYNGFGYDEEDVMFDDHDEAPDSGPDEWEGEDPRELAEMWERESENMEQAQDNKRQDAHEAGASMEWINACTAAATANANDTHKEQDIMTYTNLKQWEIDIESAVATGQKQGEGYMVNPGYPGAIEVKFWNAGSDFGNKPDWSIKRWMDGRVDTTGCLPANGLAALDIVNAGWAPASFDHELEDAEQAQDQKCQDARDQQDTGDYDRDDSEQCAMEWDTAYESFRARYMDAIRTNDTEAANAIECELETACEAVRTATNGDINPMASSILFACDVQLRREWANEPDADAMQEFHEARHWDNWKVAVIALGVAAGSLLGTGSASAANQCAMADAINAIPDVVRGGLVAGHVDYYKAQGCTVFEDMSLMPQAEHDMLQWAYTVAGK